MSAVRNEQRFVKGRRCPICGGADSDARGGGRRCSGFLSSDGKYAHCSREDQAGTLPIEENGTTYAHRLAGPCRCGIAHGEPEQQEPKPELRIVATYLYRLEDGAVEFEVVRFEPKTFRQRREVNGRWEWKLGDCRRVLYRLPEIAASSRDDVVFVVEGEKDADAMAARGFVATTCPMGAEKWRLVDNGQPASLLGRDVIVIPDDDEPGRKHAAIVRASLAGHARSVRTCKLPAKDVSDWFAAGHTADELRDIIANNDAEHEASPADEQADPFTAEIATALVDVKAKLETANAPRPPMFGDAVELLAAQFDAPRWLVTGLVTRGGITMIGAEPKAAKTWLALELALAVASGTRALGEFYAEQGRVAYFLAEDMNVQARNRVRALIAGAGRTLNAGRLFLQPRGVFLDILRDEDLAYIVASCRRLDAIDLLVLDPLRDIHDGEEDKSDSMRNVMRRLRLLADLLGCTVAVVHHAPKQTKDNAKRRPGQNLRGSSAIHGSVDSGIYLEDSNGDGTNLFTNTVTSQVKGARSAGRFRIELDVKDNAEGEAIEARWTFSREFPKPGTVVNMRPVQNADDLIVAAWIRKLAQPMTKTALRTHPARPVPERRCTSAIDRCLEQGLLALHEGLVGAALPVQTECSLDA